MAGRGAAGAGREAILDAALARFAERGVAGTSLQQIADDLQVTKAAIYHHFRTKDSIVIAVLSPGLDELTQQVARAQQLSDADDRAEVVIGGLAQIICTQRHRYAVMMADPAVPPILAADPRIGPLLELTRELLVGPAPSAERELGVALFLGACNGPAQPGVTGRENSQRWNPGWTTELVQELVTALGRHLVLHR